MNNKKLKSIAFCGKDSADNIDFVMVSETTNPHQVEIKACTNKRLHKIERTIHISNDGTEILDTEKHAYFLGPSFNLTSELTFNDYVTAVQQKNEIVIGVKVTPIIAIEIEDVESAINGDDNAILRLLAIASTI